MSRFLLLVLTVSLMFCALPPDVAVAQAPALPAVDANGDIAPLTVDQLDPQERVQFAALAPGSDDARKFLYTRGFLRYSRLVVDRKLPAKDLPALPALENWDRKFLSAEEARNILDVALGLSLMAMMPANPPPLPAARAATNDLPAVDANGQSQPLTVDQLDAQERVQFNTLAAGGDDARKFLYTRGYVRFCRLVVTGALPPLQLPELPARENWDRRFLSEDEGKAIVDVALGRKIVAEMTPAPRQ